MMRMSHTVCLVLAAAAGLPAVGCEHEEQELGPTCGFVDANLEREIRSTIGLSSGEIPCSRLAALEEFDVPRAEITDLKGLEALAGLTSLDVSGNQVAGLFPISRFTKLTVLLFRENRVRSIGMLSGLKALEELDLSANAVSELAPLSGLTALTELDLSNNLVESLGALSGLTAISHLDLSRNQITDIAPLAANSGLGEGDRVEIWGNPIDCKEQAAPIKTLRGRGVDLDLDCPEE